MAGMLCGVTVFAYVTSTVSSLLTTFNTQSMRTQEQQRNIDAFCRGHRLPKPLARKLSGFYDYVLPKMIHKEDTSIIARLPDTLQQQVCTHRYHFVWKLYLRQVAAMLQSVSLVHLDAQAC